MTDQTTTPAGRAAASRPRPSRTLAQKVSTLEIREGDTLAFRVDEQTLEVSGKTVKVDEISYGRKGLYVFVNKRFRFDAGGFTYRVA